MCFNLFAQEVKPCLFIGVYDNEKKGICSDKTWIHEEINDIAEYEKSRLQFKEAHKNDESFSTSTVFVSDKESVIVYQFKKNISGFDCKPNIIGFIKGTTIEDCKEQLAAQVTKNFNYYVTQPTIIYTRQGNGGTQKQTLTEDLGGVTAKFNLVSKSNGGDFVVAQFTNTTSDKRAILSIKTIDGKVLPSEYIKPGETLSKKYEAKSLDIQLIYDGNVESKSPSLIDAAKTVVRKLLEIDNGKLITKPSASVGVRG